MPTRRHLRRLPIDESFSDEEDDFELIFCKDSVPPFERLFRTLLLEFQITLTTIAFLGSLTIELGWFRQKGTE